MTVISESAEKHFVLKMLRNVMAHSHRAQRKIARGQSLRHANEIRNNFPMIDGKPFSSSSEASHYFVGDHQDAVFLAQLAHAFEISIGRNQNAVRANHSFENECGDRLRALKLNGLFDHGERGLGRFPSALDAMIGIEHMYHPRYARLRGPSAGIAGESDASASRSVIGAIARHDLVPSGEEASEFDGVLSGFRAAVGEEEGVDVAGSDFGKLGAKAGTNFRGHERIRISQRCSLLGDGFDDAFIAVTDVDGHQLTVEIDIALAFGRVEINSPGAGNRNRINLRLRGPFVERVLFAEVNDFFAG